MKGQSRKFEVSSDGEHFVHVPNWIIEKHGKRIGVLGIAVYVALKKFADYGTGECYPSMETVADIWGMGSRNTVVKAIEILESEGLLSVQKGSKVGDRHHYFIRSREIQPCSENEHAHAQNLTSPCSKNEHVIKEELEPRNETQTAGSLFLTPTEENVVQVLDDPIVKAFTYFCTEAGKTGRYVLTPDRRKMAEKRWKESVALVRAEGVATEDVRGEVGRMFKKAIDKIVASDWHYDNGFLEWDQVFKSESNFTKWLDRAEKQTA